MADLKKGDRVTKTIQYPGGRETSNGVVARVAKGVAYYRPDGADDYDEGITFSATSGRELENFFAQIGMRSWLERVPSSAPRRLAIDKPQHTQGPLRTEQRKDGDVEVVDAGGCVLATYYGDDNDPQCWPVTANARVGAAAPELLAACELALEQMTALAPTLSTASYLRAAIAKARGA